MIAEADIATLIARGDWVGVLTRIGKGKVPAATVPGLAQTYLALDMPERAIALLAPRLAARASDAHLATLKLRALQQAGQFEQAVQYGWERLNANDIPAIRFVAQNLITLQDYDACTALIERYVTDLRSRARATAIEARAALLQAQGAHPAALDCIDALAGQLPAAYQLRLTIRTAARARNSARLNALLERADGWVKAGSDWELFCELGPEIALQHFRCIGNPDVLREILDRLVACDLTASGGRMVATILLKTGRFHDAATLTDRLLQRIAGDPSLWIVQLTNAVSEGDATKVTAVRTAMAEAMPADIYRHAMLGADPRLWSLDELPTLMGHAFDSIERRQRDRFLAGLRHVRIASRQLDVAMARAETLPPAAGLTLAMALSQAIDREVLETAAIEPTSLTAFEDLRAATVERLSGPIDRCIALDDGGGLDAGSNCTARSLSVLRGIERAAPASLLSTKDCYADALGLLRILLQRIEAGVPTSAIRIGDGEGLFMPAAPELGHEMEDATDRLMQTWWGDARPDPARRVRLTDAFRAAIGGASIIGVLPYWHCLRLSGGGGARGNWRGVYNSLHAVAAMPRRDVVITSSHFPHDLHTWNLWRELFARVDEVSWISCHAISDFLWEQHGVRTRAGLRIPGEHSFAGMFTVHRDISETLLDRHDDVIARIDARPGEVWLVAAGFLGKLYCERVRQLGGIAIDIGSLADYWMGFATRVYRLEETIKSNLTTALVPDHDLPPARDHARMIGTALPARASIDGRYNIALPSDAAPATGEPKLLRVLGHARCASGYMAAAFSRHGVEIGHERVLRDGIASWLHVPIERRAPFGDGDTLSHRYLHTVIHVRDPAEALPSIMLENGIGVSFDYRRQHILRATGDDIARYDRAIDRAAASFVHWYAMALAIDHDMVIRVEDGEVAIPRFLNAIGRISIARGDAAVPIGGDARPSINTSAQKFARAKPRLDAAALRAMDGALRERIDAFCDRFGYAELGARVSA